MGLTWKEIRRRYLKRGYDLHDVFAKHKGVVKVYAMLPPLAFLAGLFTAFKLYRLTREKFVFLLPLFYSLKMVFWWFGYSRRVLGSRDALRDHKKAQAKNIYNSKT